MGLVPTSLGGPILDVGAGTGIWTEALVDWFDWPVVGLEPSAGMRKIAMAKELPARALALAGAAEAIPLRDASCCAAWLSTVIHHISDLPACATELRRVLPNGGVVLIRSSFPGRQDEIPLFHFFPGALRVASRFPTVEATVSAFQQAGFHQDDLRRVHEDKEANLADLATRVQAMRHADSTLAPLSDEEFDAGMAKLHAAVAAGAPAPPTGVDLLVLH